MKKTSLILLCSVFLFTACSTTPGQEAKAPSDPKLTGVALAAAVKGSLDNDLALQKFNLKVKAKDADVTIEGAVDEGEQIALAGMIAEKVKGVRYVDNKIDAKN
ncbi:BON domain-containing protein [Janthinobacterium sp. B9-8]|uniref:BON domain-containing protein n=1 Tax=Janthinobacterium sp. B9-8 TaxID=1236179 RepID=UPI0006993803|nr:BON domain-containing protein [Janthinobacterium sp. B9-8]AMC35485.1 hypothetical protein VN23_13110 [Janthinobacterium sp. B9-8]